MSPIPDSSLKADEALQRLKAGNARFVAGTVKFPKGKRRFWPNS